MSGSDTTDDPAQGPQVVSPSHRLAFQDSAFLLRDELRPVRLQLELLKPELELARRGIRSTVVVFGSTRIGPGSTGVAGDGRYYAAARRFAGLVAAAPESAGGQEFVIVTGGGPGIMEAANRGAAEAGAPTVGLSIALPQEQHPNRWVTPELSFQFHYFALRKMHFMMRARALVFFPGGFGTLDEMFDALTLVQTGKIDRLPVLLFDRAYWSRIVRFDALVAAGTISPADAELVQYVETPEQAWEIVRTWSPKLPAGAQHPPV